MDYFGIAASSLIPVLVLSGGAIIKRMIDRLDSLEDMCREILTEDQTRKLIDDKLEVVKDDHQTNRNAIIKLFDLYSGLRDRLSPKEES